MEINQNQKQIYIVLSQTGTFLSQMLKKVTKAEYNHSSISLSADLKCMYSFGRRRPYNPFWAGFVAEAPNAGTFKRFPNTEAIVFAVDISEENYNNLYKMLHDMYSQRKKYHYNYLGLVFAAFGAVYHNKYCYYCSEFVKEILLKHQINGAEQLPPIVQPIHFLNLPHKLIYRGKLSEYTPPFPVILQNDDEDKVLVTQL